MTLSDDWQAIAFDDKSLTSQWTSSFSMLVNTILVAPDAPAYKAAPAMMRHDRPSQLTSRRPFREPAIRTRLADATRLHSRADLILRLWIRYRCNHGLPDAPCASLDDHFG